MIDEKQLQAAIRNFYPAYTDKQVESNARYLLEITDPSLYPDLEAFSKGEPFPEHQGEEFSIPSIMALRPGQDVVEAFELLSFYKKNPDLGKARILSAGTRLFR